MADDASPPPTDVLIVGAGFAGLYAAHKMRSLGFSVRGLERAADVGGVWYWNRYPGARCDAQSLVYCYMFDEALHREWRWSERYAQQPEILRYIRWVADRLDLRDLFSFGTDVVQARFDADTNLWTVTASDGKALRTRWLVFATGALSASKIPDIAGFESFAGETYHTSSWPADGVDFTGKRVAVIGTGSSGVQSIPRIAEQAQKLIVFQRTPAFIAPANNARVSDEETERFLGQFDDYRRRMRAGEIAGIGDVQLSEHLPPTLPTAEGLKPEDIRTILQNRWDVGGVVIQRAFRDVLTNPATNAIVADFYREKIKEAVRDPATAEKLTPRGFPVGSKRVCVGSDFYQAFNRDNVELVSLLDEPLRHVTPAGLETEAAHYPVDAIVFATGFDAFTGALDRIDIQGPNGSLRDKWAEGAETYLGIAMADFPNLFVITGPGSPSALTTVTTSIEQHVDWLGDLLVHAREQRATRIEADYGAEVAWTEHVRQAAAATLFVQGKSWYLGANVPGKPQVFLALVGGPGPYRQICDEVAADGYRGFRLTP